MTLTGAALNWPTTGRAAGDYAVSVRVTDAAGLSDTKQFTVTLQPASAAAPVAVDDAYAVRLGQTLTVPASGVVGVLGNDSSPSGNALNAVKLTNPDKGTLSAFNANGGFTYQAPAVLPGSPFVPVLRNHADLAGFNAAGGAAVMIDLDGDGKPELLFRSINQTIVAVRADTGATLWRFDGSFFTGCTPFAGIAEFPLTVGDIDDDGKPEVLFMASCAGDNGSQRVVALNGQNGTVKWISARLEAFPVIGDSIGLAERPAPTIARLRPGESPSVLLAAELIGAHRVDAITPINDAACRYIVETVPDGTYQPNPALPPHYFHCTGVIVLNGADGSIRQRMIAERFSAFSIFRDGSREGHGDLHTVVVDLDGDGVPEIVTNGAVFNVNGSVRWTGAPSSVYDIAVGNFDDTPDVEVVRRERGANGTVASIAVYKQNGTLLWRLPVDDTTFGSKITVADLDGDGKADIVFSEGGLLCAINHLGVYRWCYDTVIAGVSRVDSRTRYAIFDFDGDGVAEVVVQTTQAILFLDGATGKVKATFPITQASTGSSLPPPPTEGVSYHSAAPLVGDVDADGHADLVFFWTGNDLGATARLTVLKGQNNDWRPARIVQNQFAYYPANINDNGTIPALPLVNSFALPRTNVFGTQAQVLPPVDPRARTQTSFTYKATDGTLDSPPAKVVIDIAPANRPPKFDSTPPTRYVQSVGAPFTYTAHATDPDVGDTVTYSLFSQTYGGGSCAMTANTGVLSCNYIQTPYIVFVITATDSQGDSSFQTLVMTGASTSSTVPNVIGQSQAVAATTLTAAGLTTGVVTQLSNPAPVGQVISQAPAPGTSILTGEAVAITVSTGPVPVIVPFVVGETLTLANTKLTTLGFTVAVTPQFSSTIPVNQVMAQSPVAGTALVPIPANPVTVTTSAGPPLAGVITQIIVEPGTTTRLVGENQQYKATAIFNDKTSADVTLAATWSSSLSGVATVNAVGLARAVANGGTTLQATVGAISGQTTLSVVARVTGDSVLPVALITAPAAGGTITGPTTVTGTATDANFLRYELAVALATDTAYTLIAEGTAPVSGGTLGTIDPTTLLNDLYTLRLTVFDRAGNQTVATSTIQVSGNMKIGLFTLGFQDLNIPLAGIPITVTRTYDSRDKGKGDFGIGWRLGLQTLRLRANRVPGTGWVRSTAGAVVSLAPTSEHKVSLTLGDGRVEEFDMVVSPTANLGSLNATNVTGYVARPGTLGKLQVLGNTSLLILNGGLEDELVDDITLNTYNPQLFRYTTLDGTQIEIDRGEGVKKITDSNGNSLTFGANGIIHSTGRSVTFTRDLQNRITQITDPLGNVQSYIYDGNGDLVSHTNAMANVSRYKYNRNHDLIEIQDPTGNRAARNDYDASGRLISMTDANGNQITFTHNVSAQEELITDRRGNVTRALYDSRGNVLSKEKGVTINGVLVNAVTTTTYDAQNNETSRVDPDGLRSTGTFSGVLPLTQVVDPAGLNLNTSFAYNARNDVTTAMDPGGRAYTFSYDGSGNLTSVNTPVLGSSTSSPDVRGQPVSTVDAQGNRKALTRDAVGNITREETFDTSATLLRRVDSTYDAYGNKLSETLYRTINGVLTPLTMQYVYDAAHRMTSATDPSGGITRTEYDAAGRVTKRIDPLGRSIGYSYDSLGRRVGTTYPDGTFDTMTYDVEGNVATQTDSAGRTTTFTYDELNRSIKTLLSDGSSTQTVYSVGGRVSATIDSNGNRTDYTYDSIGRQTGTRFPAVVDGVSGPPVRPQVSQSLNAMGAADTITDPKGRTTSFVYDAAGHPVQTTFADGGTVTQTFDVLRRRTSVTNEEGQTTNYGYDGLSRLISVSGLAGTATYSYDEAGNVLAEADALGRVTRFRYDALNRRIERKYPGGDTEQFAYNAVGNVIAFVDAMGRTTTLIYDNMNRVTRKTLPGGASVSYTYKPDGQRATAIDSRGTTSYAYDSLGRPSAITHPTGETVNHTRDANGNLLTLTSPAATTSYGYDAMNRLVQVTAPEGQSQYFYDLAGNRVRSTAANGIITDTSFNNRNRPSSLIHKTPGNTVLRSYTNAYSPAGRRTSVTELDGAVENYTYDARGRLATQLRTGSNPLSISHTYDLVGNRTQTVRDGVTSNFAYNVNDQLLSDGTASYAYDANGNVVSSASGLGAKQYVYDPENQLVSITGSGVPAQYAYDADGNRVSASASGGTTRFLTDTINNTGLSQVLEERNGSGSLQARYTFGSGLLAMSRGADASFYHRDSHGNTRALTDGAGAVTDSYQYDAYGQSISTTGTTNNPYQYSGERNDSESGLYQLRARYYHPGTGRFMSRDPFGGRHESPVSRHRYLYANADPVNGADPTGLDTLVELSVVQGITIAQGTAAFVSGATAICNAASAADQVNALIAMSRLLFVAGSAAQAIAAVIGNVTNGIVGDGRETGTDSNVTQIDKSYFGMGLTNSVGYVSPVLGGKSVKQFSIKAIQSGGKFGIGLGVSFHNIAAPSVSGEVLFLPPPDWDVKGMFEIAEEKIIYSFKYCAAVSLGKLFIKAKAGVGGSNGSTKGKESGAVKGGLGVELGLSLFGGALEWGFPLVSIDQSNGQSSVTLFGSFTRSWEAK